MTSFTLSYFSFFFTLSSSFAVDATKI